MMPFILNFFRDNLSEAEVQGKDVIEIGSRYVNGSVRAGVEAKKPASYIGVDVCRGPCVDRVCDCNDLLEHFREESADIVISCEMLEHVSNFPRVIANLKKLVRIGGLILLSTCARGARYHGYPYDFWRYEVDDLRRIFADFEIIKAEKDPQLPSVVLKARRAVREITDISTFPLYNICYNAVMPYDKAAVEKITAAALDANGENYFSRYVELANAGIQNGCDKAAHGYLQKYELFLRNYKDDAFNLLELGALPGASLKMWRDYFPRAQIYSCDIALKSVLLEADRIHVNLLDLLDLKSYGVLNQRQYRLIVDDASNLCQQQVLSLIHLFPSLESGGAYILEDLHTSFPPAVEKFKGRSDITACQFLLSLAESVMAAGMDTGSELNYRLLAESMAREIDLIAFIQKSCIIIKK